MHKFLPSFIEDGVVSTGDPSSAWTSWTFVWKTSSTRDLARWWQVRSMTFSHTYTHDFSQLKSYRYGQCMVGQTWIWHALQVMNRLIRFRSIPFLLCSRQFPIWQFECLRAQCIFVWTYCPSQKTHSWMAMNEKLAKSVRQMLRAVQLGLYFYA